MDSRQLAIPIYLNQRIVFDLLATVEGGFSQLQTIRSSESSVQTNKSEANAQIGTSNVFAFLGIGVGGSRAKDNAEQKQRDVAEERVFTPASLFSRMRDVLIERELLVAIDDKTTSGTLRPGAFVEFPATLRMNPLVEALEAFIRLIDLVSAIEGQPRTANNSNRKPSNKDTNPSKSDNAIAVRMMKGLLADITVSQKLDLVASLGDNGTSAVVPVELDYFADRSPAAIIDGQFVVLGKVVRAISAENDSIDLLRGTSLGSMSEQIIGALQEAFAEVGVHGIRFPEIVTNVAGPAIQVIPIGIYA